MWRKILPLCPQSSSCPCPAAMVTCGSHRCDVDLGLGLDVGIVKRKSPHRVGGAILRYSLRSLPKVWPDTQFLDVHVLQVYLDSFGSFSYRECHLLMWHLDGLDKDWGLHVGWRILASSLTRPGKALSQKPLNCRPHPPPQALWLYGFLVWEESDCFESSGYQVFKQ